MNVRPCSAERHDSARTAISEASAVRHRRCARNGRRRRAARKFSSDCVGEKAHSCPCGFPTSQIGILREQTNRAGICGIGDLIPAGLFRYSRRARSLFPQGSFFIPAGLVLYSRRAVPLFPQDWRFVPAGPVSRPRAFRSCPACADGDGRDPYRQACGPATIVRLLRSAVARRPQRRAS